MDLVQNINLTSIVWIAGLAASLIAFVGLLYQKRRLDHDPYGYADELAWIVALYFGLGIFCLGLALATFSSASSLSIWVGNIWLSLALLLFVRFFLGLVEGLRNGWHEDQVDGGPLSGAGLWMGVAALLLFVNLGLVLWAGLTTDSDGPQTAATSSAGDSMAAAGSTSSETDATAEPASDGANPEENQDEETPLTELLPTPTREEETASAPVLPLPTSTTEAPPDAPIIETTETQTDTLPAAEPVDLVLLPTPTPSPPDNIDEPAPADLADPAAVMPGIVIGEVGINARGLPDLSADIVGALPEGASVNASGRSPDGEWLQLALEDGRSAWVAAFLVQLEGAAADLPIVGGE